MSSDDEETRRLMAARALAVGNLIVRLEHALTEVEGQCRRLRHELESIAEIVRQLRKGGEP